MWPLMFLLCYWGACRGASVGASPAGLRPFLDLLLGDFGKFQVTQIIQFAIYKAGNADAK